MAMHLLARCMSMATDTIAPPLQSGTELSRLLKRLELENVNSYLEIGARYGGTFEAVMSQIEGKGVAVDFPGGNFGDENSAITLSNTISKLRASGRDVHVVFGPSSAPEVVDRVAKHGPYDCVMIDADHSLKAISRDYEIYARMARKIIAIHDIAAPDDWKNRDGHRVQVGKFWRYLKKHIGDNMEEIIEPGSNMGIGIIFK